MPWPDPAQQPGPSAGAQDPAVSYGKALDLMFAVLVPRDTFWTTGFRPQAVFEP